MSSLLNVKLVVASLEGDVFEERFLGGFLGLARVWKEFVSSWTMTVSTSQSAQSFQQYHNFL